MKEENSKLYSVNSYYFGRTLIEIPYLVLLPILFSVIIYWMVGFNDSESEIVFVFIFLTMLSSLNGNALGLVTGSAFSTVKQATAMMPLLLLPMMLFGGLFKNRDYYISTSKKYFDCLISIRQGVRASLLFLIPIRTHEFKPLLRRSLNFSSGQLTWA